MKPAIVVAMACLAACMARAQNPGHALRALVEVADSLPTFNADDYIYNRIYRQSSRAADWSRLVAANYDPDTLAALAGDARPRVRTLAMVLLFNKEDPRLLLPVAEHLSDTEKTFPVLLPTANADPRATAPQTVGDIAKQLLGTYMLAAGMNEWREPRVEDWTSYEMRHRDRAHSLSALAVRLSRITEMSTPFREDRRPELLKFRKDLDEFPPEDRDLYLLWLCNGEMRPFDGGDVLANETELVEAAKRLGRQKLLQIIDGRPPGTDPDLPASAQWQSQTRYRAVVSFILAHADRLLTPSDEPFLAVIEQGARDKIARGSREDLETVSVEALGQARAMLLKLSH